MLGAYVSDHLEGDEGPIREYYIDKAAATGYSRIEICWPIFNTSASPSR